MDYKNFIYFLEQNIQNDNELDLIIYNIGLTLRIVQQFAHLFNQKIEQEGFSDDIDFLVQFETECNEKIHLALNIGDSATLFIECYYQNENILININKQKIAELTLEGMRNE